MSKAERPVSHLRRRVIRRILGHEYSFNIEFVMSLTRYRSSARLVVIEAYLPLSWERYANEGISMHSFGLSLPGRRVRVTGSLRHDIGSRPN